VTVLLVDDFNRANSATVGGGWTEVEGTGATVEIASNACLFTSADNTLEPILHQAFTAQTTGVITWSFDMSWTRVGEEGTYRLYMQMGDSASIVDSNADTGIGVNLIWTAISGTHESLASRDGGVNTSIKVVSGAATIEVLVDMDAQTYDVAVDATTEATDVAFDTAVTTIDTVRFLTDALATTNFTGTTFDNVSITIPDSGLSIPIVRYYYHQMERN